MTDLRATAPAVSTTAAPAPAALDLLRAARRALLDAAVDPDAGRRFSAAAVAALRAATAVLADRARPAEVRRGPRGAWGLVAAIAPELGEEAGYFAAMSDIRLLVEAGATTVSDRVADDLLRDACAFCDHVAHVIAAPRR
jgi:hypothetical protein